MAYELKPIEIYENVKAINVELLPLFLKGANQPENQQFLDCSLPLPTNFSLEGTGFFMVAFKMPFSIFSLTITWDENNVPDGNVTAVLSDFEGQFHFNNSLLDFAPSDTPSLFEKKFDLLSEGYTPVGSLFLIIALQDNFTEGSFLNFRLSAKN